MPRVGLEPTIPVYERAKIFRALDRAATVIGVGVYHKVKLIKAKQIHLSFTVKIIINIFMLMF
jgi:hypothetical protein